jgi:hypothetical protein
MLKAQYKNPTKKGGYVYVVDGTAAELAEYKASIPAEYLASHVTEDGRLLLFTGFVMPGKKDAWHPLYKTQTGDNAGRWSLDTAELSFQEGQLKAVKNAVLANKLADAIVADMRGTTISNAVLSQVQVQLPTEANLSNGDINQVD